MRGLFTALALLAMSAGLRSAEQGPALQDDRARSTVLVDGSSTPDKIPDDVAWRHFVRTAVPMRPDPSQDGVVRRGYLARIKLSTDDSAALVAALAPVHGQLADVADRIREASRNSLTHDRIGPLRAEEGAVFRGARERVRASLTRDGLALLDAFIQEHVKSSIKIYRVTVPSPPR